MKKYILFILLSIYVAGISAQSISVVSAPGNVSEGDVFQLTYSVNSSNINSFNLGQLPAGLRVEGGPSTYTQSSFQIINGHTSSSCSTTFTYYLSASKSGSMTIPPAKATIGGRAVSSKPVTINVTGGSGSHSSTPQGGQTTPQPQQVVPQQTKPDKDVDASSSKLFIKPILNKQRVHEQEAVVLSYKLYTKLNVKDFGGTAPDLKGFHVQKIANQNRINLTKEGGYLTGVLDQYVLYPQVSGKLEIPATSYSVLLGPDPDDPFSFFSSSSRRVNIESQSTTISVDPLPNKPADFSGAVGDFSVSSQIDKSQVKAGDPISLRVIVDGTGNLQLISAPAISIPKEFDKYDPKTTDKTTLTASGHQGSMIYDYVLVPRKEGDYTIPAVSFTYYDTASSSYKTLKTTPLNVKVLKGDGKSSMSDFSGEESTGDIRGLMKGEASLSQPGDHFFGSASYFVWLLIPVIIFIILFVAFRQHAIENANIVKMRGKKANKVATKRLKDAAALMKQNKQNEFYDEVLRALWGYVSDKLNIPVEHLSKDNISDNLESKGINYETIDIFIKAIEDCEYARYAPGDPKSMMEHVYESAVTAITDIDNMLNNKKTNNTGSSVLGLLLLLMLFPMTMSATTKQQADEAFTKGNYKEAIKGYNEVLKQGVSADVYYNLGNAYFRDNNIPQAVLAYERAYRLAPGNADIKYNLKVAQSKTIDKISTENKMFFVDWYHSIINFTSADNWAVLSIVCVILLLVSLVMYLFWQNMMVIKGSFYLAVFSLIVFVVATVCAFLQNYNFTKNKGAIIMSASVEMKKTPSDSASELVVLHEGTYVDIIDNSMKDWVEVRIADGREGWMKPSQLENI